MNDENDGIFFMPFESFHKLFTETHFCASGQADQMEVHNFFVNFNKIKNPEVFIRFTVEQAFTISEQMFMGICTNNQGNRLQRLNLAEEDKFIPAITNFILFDPNGEFMKGGFC